jgi:hypothetical protein
MIPQFGVGTTMDLLGLGVTAATGLAGTLWMGCLHRVALARCERLESEVASAREARQRLTHFTSDLVATLNFSIACLNKRFGEAERAQIEKLRQALWEALQGQRNEPPSPWGLPPEAGAFSHQ